jgi:hypothetical protein
MPSETTRNYFNYSEVSTIEIDDFFSTSIRGIWRQGNYLALAVLKGNREN